MIKAYNDNIDLTFKCSHLIKRKLAVKKRLTKRECFLFDLCRMKQGIEFLPAQIFIDIGEGAAVLQKIRRFYEKQIIPYSFAKMPTKNCRLAFICLQLGRRG